MTIDATIVRAYQHSAGAEKNCAQAIGRFTRRAKYQNARAYRCVSECGDAADPLIPMWEISGQTMNA
jgi:hypothetical protein